MSDWMSMLSGRTNRLANQSEAEKERIERKKERRGKRIGSTVENLLGIAKDYQGQQNFERQQGRVESDADRAFTTSRYDYREGIDRADKAEGVRVYENKIAEDTRKAENEAKRLGMYPEGFDPADEAQWNDERIAAHGDAYRFWKTKWAEWDAEADRLSASMSGRGGAGDEAKFNEAYDEAVGRIIGQNVRTAEEYLDVFGDPANRERLIREFSRSLDMYPDLYGGEDNFQKDNAMAMFTEMLTRAEGGEVDPIVDPDNPDNAGETDPLDGLGGDVAKQGILGAISRAFGIAGPPRGDLVETATDVGNAVVEGVGDITQNTGSAMSTLLGTTSTPDIFEEALGAPPAEAEETIPTPPAERPAGMDAGIPAVKTFVSTYIPPELGFRQQGIIREISQALNGLFAKQLSPREEAGLNSLIPQGEATDEQLEDLRDYLVSLK